MIQSMTGFGKATCEYGSKKIVIEVKSLNSKQLDISTRIANLYREKDIELRNTIAQKLERGKIDFTLSVQDIVAEQTTAINKPLIESYFQQIQDLSKELGINTPSNWMEILLRFPDVLKTEAKTLDEAEWAAVQIALNEAFDKIIAFRKAEGAAMEKMFKEKITRIGELLAEVDVYEQERVAKIKSRLEEDMRSIQDKVTIDKNRFEQEMIFYIEKLDVNEEKVRLKTHLNYFLETMEHGTSQGKKLGFIAQEMGREINTLGSKSNHSEMQKIVVKMKDQLEQIKEQVLNVL